MRELGGGIVSTVLPPPFSAGPCPAPSHYQKGRGCCINAAQRPKGAPNNAQCCKPGSTRVIKHPGGVSLACKPAPGPGGGGTGGGGGASSGSFRVTAVSGSTLTADRNLSSDCKAGQQAELRRPGVSGLAEFGGDIVSINGNQVEFTGDVQNTPSVGDTFIIYCANAGGSSGGGLGGSFDSAGIMSSLTGGGMTTWLLLGGAGLAAYFLLKHKDGGAPPPMRRYR